MIKDYVILSDTDSIYCDVVDILKHRHPSLSLKEDDSVIPKIREIATEFENELNEWYVNEFSLSHFNCKKNRLKIKSETIGKRIYISAKKQYAQLILEKEGVKMEGNKMWDFKGLDFMKSSFPKLFRTFTQGLVKDILLDTPKHIIDDKILEFRERFKTLSLEEAAKPTGINKYKEYYGGKKPGQIFSNVLTKCPVNTKAAIYYNDLLKFKGLDGEHPIIQVGDKIKWVYLTKNAYDIDVIAIHEINPPKEILDFARKYIDRQKMFDNNLYKKLEKIYTNLGWGKINFNKNVNKFFKFAK